jgi:hypothetical protein
MDLADMLQVVWESCAGKGERCAEEADEVEGASVDEEVDIRQQSKRRAGDGEIGVMDNVALATIEVLKKSEGQARMPSGRPNPTRKRTRRLT